MPQAYVVHGSAVSAALGMYGDFRLHLQRVGEFE